MTLPNCRLYLVVSSAQEPDTLARALDAALSAGDAASLLIAADSDRNAMKRTAEKLMPIAHAHDLAVLIADDAALAKELGAEGVETGADRTGYREARAVLGETAVIGVRCGRDRHTAMELAEAGADFVVIDQQIKLDDGEAMMAWWSDVVTVPVVAARPVHGESVADAVALGADFVIPDPAMWTSPEAARSAVAGTNRLVEEHSA